MLNVEQSLNKAKWVVSDVPLGEVQRAARTFDVPEIVARMLLGRGISFDSMGTFLNPTLREHFPDPFSLQGMAEMAEEVASAIEAGVSMAIFGDFDVDGATSSAVLYRFLKACGLSPRIYIPDRMDEGYGPNVPAFQTLKDEGAAWVFVLDCGITAFDVIQSGRDMGLSIVIFDHHEAEERLPAANHVIDPKRKNDVSDLDMLAAVGVTFLGCVAINKVLRERGFWDGSNEPDMRQLLGLVCLGTVCDMVPLTGANRLFVRHGFGVLNKRANVGIDQLAEVAGVEAPFDPYHLGFGLGPRINAGGRIHKADLGARLLTTDDPEEAKNIAWTLNDCNDKRREIQQRMEDEARAKVERLGLDQHAAIVVDGEDWHPGLSGLVAGRLKDLYEKPACVVTFAKNGDGSLEGRGSGRSVPGVHIAQAFIDARNEGLILKGGGHAMAGGFSIAPNKLEAFTAFVQAHVAGQMEDAKVNVTADVDAVITVGGVQLELLRVLEAMVGPFGMDFPEPLFAFSNVRLHSVDVLKEKHIRVMMSDWEGGSRIKAMAFGAVGKPLGEAMLKKWRDTPFHILGHLKVNRWQGRESAELHIKDGAFASAG